MSKKIRANTKRAKAPKQRAAARGASRSESQGSVLANGLRWLGKGFAVLIVGGVIASAVWGAKHVVENAAQRPINTIAVEGEFVFLSEQEISAAIEPMIRNGFLQLPLEDVKRKLEQNPWIATAAVSRRWPDKLFISIVEQQPIARWGADGFVNYNGEVIRVKNQGALRALPLLAGNPGQAKQMMQNYQQLSRLLRPFGLQVAEFYCDERYSWQIVLNNSLVITIGRDKIMEKVERFVTVYSRELNEQLDRVAAIDLRYGNGVAVKWREAATTADKDQPQQDGDEQA